MPRHEHDREDLLAEARALVERVEIRCAGLEEHVVAGFRRDGCASFYFGASRAYHFNARGQLRRAFDHGRLLKADRGRLAALVRRRTENQVQLLRHDLDDAELRDYLDQVRGDVRILATALTGSDFDVIGCVPQDADVVGRIGNWLAQLAPLIVVADVPNVGQEPDLGGTP